MRLRNRSEAEQRILDAGDGAGRTVAPGAEADFSEQGARELLASFPSEWETGDGDNESISGHGEAPEARSAK